MVVASRWLRPAGRRITLTAGIGQPVPEEGIGRYGNVMMT